MLRIFSLGAILLCLVSCKSDTKSNSSVKEVLDAKVNSTAYEKATKDPYIEFRGLTVESRFIVPEGYIRSPVEENSFGEYLRQLPLKTPGSPVLYFDGNIKPNDDIYIAVVDQPIGNSDLHQCADAIMRLRAEHLWFQQRYEDIHFNFTNGHRVEYSEWMKGRRMIVEGNTTKWDSGDVASNTFKDLWNYLELIFTYAGTLSLSKELKRVPLEKLSIGDIFIQGGSPGHAVVIVDIAVSAETNEKIFLVAQSYMPAQQTHILTNRNGKLGPWYSLNEGETLRLPEWEFDPDDLMRFAE